MGGDSSPVVLQKSTPSKKRRLSELDTNVPDSFHDSAHKLQKSSLTSPGQSQSNSLLEQQTAEHELLQEEQELQNPSGTQCTDGAFSIDEEAENGDTGKAIFAERCKPPENQEADTENAGLRTQIGDQQQLASQDPLMNDFEIESQPAEAFRKPLPELAGEDMLDEFLAEQEEEIGEKDAGHFEFEDEADAAVSTVARASPEKRTASAQPFQDKNRLRCRPVAEEKRRWLEEEEEDLCPPSSVRFRCGRSTEIPRPRQLPEKLKPEVMPYQQPKRFAGDTEGAVMSVIGTGGEQVFCELRDEDEGGYLPDLRGSKGQLLAEPISQLLEAAEQCSFHQAVRISEREAVQLRAAAGRPRGGETQLWVDKYRPRVFLDLLSDEKINLEVLKWLKQWDGIVFGRDPPGQKKPQGGPANAVKRPYQALEQRVLLLSGPPGLGKTTLAHVVARHCGYRPVEINASDDRTAGALHTRLTAAAEMKSVIGAKLPNCIIIDEIDGAAGGNEGKGAISTLLKLTQPAQFSGPEDGPQELEAKRGMQDKRRKKRQALNRPIIAICNDLYAPVLRPLRNVAAILSFAKPRVNRLVLRMQKIVKEECLEVEQQALLTLAEKAECDVRSCLNTLQFLAKRGGRITVSTINDLNVGQKDTTKGAFVVWKQLLSSRAVSRMEKKEESKRLLGQLADFGDHELVINGLHENVLSQRYQDPNLQRTCTVYDNLLAADRLLTRSRRTMEFGFLSYVPATIMGVHGAVAEHQYHCRRLQWPRSQGDMARGVAENRSLLESWKLGFSKAAFASLAIGTAVKDVIPYLLRIIARPLRAVAPHLFTPTERESVAELVSTLNEYNFTFDLTSPQLAGHMPPLLLKPELQNLSSFPSMESAQAGSVGMPVAARQLVVHVAHMERLRQREKALTGSEKAASQQLAADVARAERPASAATPNCRCEAAGKGKPAIPVQQAGAGAAVEKTGRTGKKKANWLDQLRCRKEQRKPSAAVMALTSAKGDDDIKARLPVFYKYNEGFTNAVKRPLRLEDLL